MATAAQLNRLVGSPDGPCPMCGGGLWYQPIMSSSAYVCDTCDWLTFDRPGLSEETQNQKEDRHA